MFWSLLRDCNYDVFTSSSRSCGASGMFDVSTRSLELFKSSSKYFPHFLLTHLYLLENPHFFYSSLLHCFTAQKWSFPLGISSVNVTKSTWSCGFSHIYWWKSLMEHFIFCVVFLVSYDGKYFGRLVSCCFFLGFNILISLVIYHWIFNSYYHLTLW